MIVQLQSNEPALSRFQLSCFRVSTVASVVGLLLSIISLVLANRYREVFAWLIFYVPLMWLLWIACVFLMRSALCWKRLLLLWLIIDLTILVLFFSLAYGENNWTRSQGIDVVVSVVYLPVAFPTLFLLYLLPHELHLTMASTMDYASRQLGVGIGDIISIWLLLSVVAAIQSLLIYGISRMKFRSTGSSLAM